MVTESFPQCASPVLKLTQVNIKDAGVIAGMDVMRIINEPIAADIACGPGQTEQGALRAHT